MNTDPRRASANIASSVRARLVALAHERGEDAGMLFTRYALERFLYRLGQSTHRNDFVLKGAMLLRALDPTFRRAAKDLDLLGFGSSDAERVAACFRDCCAIEVEDDGLDFDASALTYTPIRFSARGRRLARVVQRLTRQCEAANPSERGLRRCDHTRAAGKSVTSS